MIIQDYIIFFILLLYLADIIMIHLFLFFCLFLGWMSFFYSPILCIFRKFSVSKKKKKFLSLWVEETHSPTPAPHYISNLFLPVLEEILLLLLTPPPQVLIMDDFSAAPFQLPVDIKMALSLVLWICINSEINSNVLLTKNIQTFEVFYIFLNIESWEKNNF